MKPIRKLLEDSLTVRIHQPLSNPNNPLSPPYNQPCTWEEVERHTARLDGKEVAAKEDSNDEEVEKDSDVEILNEEPLKSNMADMMTCSELKTGLLENFLGNSEDSNRWMLSLQAYFEINSFYLQQQG